MAFDRSKFKAPKLETNKRVSEEVNKTLKVNNSSRGDYLTIDEGINLFRLFPPHPAKPGEEEQPTMQPKVVYWLECRVQKTDANGEPIEGEFEWKRRPIFDSRIHGGTPKDIIDEYIKFTKAMVFDTKDTETAKKMIAPINGWRDKSGKWNPGILPSQSFVAYATKGDITIANLGRLELFQAEKNELERLNIDETSGEPISTDIWSDPDDGQQFVLNRVKNDKGKWEHIITKRTFTPTKGSDVTKEWQRFMDSQKIPDDVLEHWSKMEPLETQFRNAYKRSDYEKAVEALMKFDKDNGFNTFENDEFLDIMREIDTYYPEDAEEEQAETSEMEAGAVDFDEMTRSELKEYIKAKNLGIRVLKSMSDEDIVKAIIAAEAGTDEEEEEEEDEQPAPHSTMNKKPGAGAGDSVSAGAGAEAEDNLPWEKGDEQPAPPAASEASPRDAAKALRERLAGKAKK